MTIACCGMTAITGTGAEPISDAVVLVQDGRIYKVGPAREVPIPRGAKRIDLTGRFLLPGMIDCHIHCLMDASPDPMRALVERGPGMLVLQGAEHLRRTLHSGVTRVRDLGGMDYLEISLREAVADRLIPGPVMQVAGRIITMTGGHGHPIGRETDGEADAMRAAREQLKAGADVIKVMATGGVMTPGVEPGAAQLTEEEMRAAISEGRKAGRRSATHAQGTEGIKNAVRAGVDSVEHGLFLDEETVQLMKKKDVWLVPTLTATDRIVEAGTESGIPEHAVRKAEAARESHLESFRLALDAGVRVAMGTDAGTPFNRHGENTGEIERMVRAGMPPLGAITAATGNAAELLGVASEVGTLAPGRLADMVVFGADPTCDISNIQSVERVYVRGRCLR